MRYVFAGMLCVLAIVPAWVGGALGYYDIWPHYHASGSVTTIPPVSFSGMLGSPSFVLYGGEVLAFVVGCLLLAACLFTTAGFLFFKRGDTESSASD
jgi:hypothetical protein